MNKLWNIHAWNITHNQKEQTTNTGNDMDKSLKHSEFKNLADTGRVHTRWFHL